MEGKYTSMQVFYPALKKEGIFTFCEKTLVMLLREAGVT